MRKSVSVRVSLPASNRLIAYANAPRERADRSSGRLCSIRPPKGKPCEHSKGAVRASSRLRDSGRVKTARQPCRDRMAPGAGVAHPAE